MQQPRHLSAVARVRLNRPHDCLERLCACFEEAGAQVERDGEGGRIVLDYGSAVMRSCARWLTLEVTASEGRGLAYVKGGLAYNLEDIAADEAPSIVWRGDGAAGDPLPNFRQLRVVSARAITPRMRRVTLAGEDLGRFADGGMHVKLLIPPQGVNPEWPVLGANGLPAWPTGPGRPNPRSYTIRSLDADAGLVSIDFALHGGTDYPGAGFAARASAGDVIGITGPGGGGVPAADWLLVAGDETALPAIARVLEALPPHARGHAFIEVEDGAEEQRLVAPPGVAIAWLHRDGRAAGTTTLLVDAVREVTFPDDGSTVFCWAGAEFAAIQTIRAHWRGERGLDRSRHLAVAYWRRGRAGG